MSERMQMDVEFNYMRAHRFGKRARLIETLALQMLSGCKEIHLASPSKQEAESVLNAAKTRCAEMVKTGN